MTSFSALFWENLVRTPHHVAYCVAFVCMVLIWLLSLYSRHDESVDSSVTISALLLITGCCEIYGAFGVREDMWWMFRYDNLLFGLLFSAVVFFMTLLQFYAWKDNLETLSLEGGFINCYAQGRKSMILFVVAVVLEELLICHWAVLATVVLSFCLYQLYVIGVPLYSALKNKGSLVRAVLSVLVYLGTVAGLICFVVRFIVAVLFVLFVAIPKEDYCETCNSYNNSYCYYRHMRVSKDRRACKKYR